VTYTFYDWRAVWCLPNGLGVGRRLAALMQIFSSNKISATNRKKGFHTSRLLKNEITKEIFVISSKKLLTLFKIQNQNFKILTFYGALYPWPIQWYHSQADLIWTDNTFNYKKNVLVISNEIVRVK
jgi:hypothetical protein